MPWLRWKEENTLGRKEAFNLKTNFFLCNTRKGSLQDKAGNSEILCVNTMNNQKGYLMSKVISLIGLEVGWSTGPLEGPAETLQGL